MKRLLHALRCVGIAILTALPHQSITAQAAQDVTGQWTFQLGKRTLFVLTLQSSSGQSGPIAGGLSRPKNFSGGDDLTFTDIQGPTEIERIMASHWQGNILSFTTENAKDPSDKTAYTFTLTDSDHAQLKIEDLPLPPLAFVRSKGGASVSTDWHAGQRYSPDDDAPSNPEMKKIYDEDQRVRQSLTNIDWRAVAKSDAARQTETMKLLSDGALHSGEDFNWAAFVFQHGFTPDDYLLAHTLAMVAVKKGYSDAIWIASATLDRYLQSIKQPQIYGTQFVMPDGKATTQNPYNRTLIPDALRRDLKVPNLAAQELQRQQYDSQLHSNSKNAKP